MIPEFPELNEFVDEYNEVMKLLQSKAIFVRGIEIQNEQIQLVDEILTKTRTHKNQSVNEANETKANFLLCLELVAEAIRNEFFLIISLKEDKAAIAWEYLVEAQNLISLSIRNNPFGGDYLLGYAQRLHFYEILLFPRMMFASRGCVVGKTECSICNKDYSECEHLKGNCYMGEICVEIIHEIISIDEISLVDNPADKRCRTISFSNNGKHYDVLTHREITE